VGERTSHAPGTFSWVDVSTTDQEGAKRFYQELFGWEADDVPAGEGIVYSMMKLDGRSVAAISPQQEQQREMGVPPVWNSYVTVEEADAAANKAKELGANLFAEPFDVFDAGRMAVIQDPQGAVFMVWEPRESIGAELVNVPGALTLNQLNTSDPEAAGRFYGDLFGWRIEQVSEEPEQPYWGIYNGDRLNGGMMGHQGPAPPHWLPYFASEDVDAASAKIAELGGNVIIGPMDIPSGRIAVAQDPQGAYFALFAGRFDD
jgi:predicted enzyme related to lactoylglutathione lyase